MHAFRAARTASDRWRAASELLCPGPQLDFPRPSAPVLPQNVQVAARDLVGLEHAVNAPLGGPGVVAPT